MTVAETVAVARASEEARTQQQATRFRVRPRAEAQTCGDFQLRVFTCVLAVGEVELVDFAPLHAPPAASGGDAAAAGAAGAAGAGGHFVVSFFDVRHATKAASELPLSHPELFGEMRPDEAELQPCRCVKVRSVSATGPQSEAQAQSQTQSQSLETVTSSLSRFGTIERVGYAGWMEGGFGEAVLVEFCDWRASEAAVAGDRERQGVGVTGREAEVKRSTCSSGGGGMFEIDAGKIREGKDTRTTCMMRNIPNKYSQRMLLKLIDQEGFAESYDFFYCPVDLRQKANCGFAFISFVDSETVIRFVEKFDGKRWDKFNSNKICKITFARLQGKHMLMEHFRSSSIMQQGKHVRPHFREDLGPQLAPSLLEELNNWLNAQNSDCESLGGGGVFSETSSTGGGGFAPSFDSSSPWTHLVGLSPPAGDHSFASF